MINSSLTRKVIFRDLMAQQRLQSFSQLMVTNGKKETWKLVNIQFFMIDCKSIFNCNFIRSTLATLGVISLKIHLKVNYHTNNGVVAMMEAYLEVCRSCFLVSLKLYQGAFDYINKESMLIKEKKEFDEPRGKEKSKGNEPLQTIIKLYDI